MESEVRSRIVNLAAFGLQFQTMLFLEGSVSVQSSDMDSSLDSKTIPNANSSSELLLYHCVCGQEFKVEICTGGTCPKCGRVVRPEAIQLAMSATVTIGDLSKATAFSLKDHAGDDAFIGRTLGHFTLDRQLGRGGMGAVYHALDNALQRYVAVKVVRGDADDGSTNRNQIANMMQEAIAQARLNHPNVVTIYYVGQHGTDPFLAMELVAGPTLAEKLKDGPLSYDQSILFALQIADALRHAAQFGIIHADIKPSNLLVASPNQIKLSDFGLSRIGSAEVEDTAIAGTLAYLAPEVIDGVPVSQQSDMYALGVTLFELVFGRLPYELKGSNARARLESRRSAQVEFPHPWPKHIPLEFKALISRLLADQPEDRFPDYDSLISAMSKIQPSAKTPAGFAPRAMAYAVDQLLLLSLIAPFFALLLFVNVYEPLSPYRWVSPFIALLSFSVQIVYLFLIRRGWRSPGRFLFQLQIVDEHGMPLRNDVQMGREMLRSMFTLLIPIAFYIGTFWPVIDRIIDTSLFLFISLDVIFFFVTRNRKTLHDVICHSHVVLDVRSSQLGSPSTLQLNQIAKPKN